MSTPEQSPPPSASTSTSTSTSDATPAPTEESVATLLALGPIRHACHACGTCCTGWRVQLKTLMERRRVQTQAAELGIADPIVEGVIRRVDGSCVFLREDKLCAIHARFGEAEKPEICKQFPRRSRHAEDGVRIGVDPGCSSNWRTFANGPEMKVWGVRSSKVWPLDPELAASEGALIELSRAPGMTIPLYIAVMSKDQSHLPAPNAGFVARVFERLALINPYLGDAGNGPILFAQLAPIARLLGRVERGEPLPAWSLPPEADAFALHLLASYLFLRIGDDTIPPVAQMILVLGGILACAYADPTPSVFGPALSAWSRMCRYDRFWEPALPDRATAQYVLYGPAGVTPPDLITT